MSILSIFSTWFILIHSVVVLVHCSFLTYNMLPFLQNYSLTTVSVTDRIIGNLQTIYHRLMSVLFQYGFTHSMGTRSQKVPHFHVLTFGPSFSGPAFLVLYFQRTPLDFENFGRRSFRQQHSLTVKLVDNTFNGHVVMAGRSIIYTHDAHSLANVRRP